MSIQAHDWLLVASDGRAANLLWSMVNNKAYFMERRKFFSPYHHTVDWRIHWARLRRGSSMVRQVEHDEYASLNLIMC